VGFRDDREANVQRIETLERDLVAAKNELEAALLRSVEIDDLRKRMVDLTRERDALRTGAEPGWATRRRVITLGALLVVSVVGFVAYYVDGALRRELRVATAQQTLAESARDQAEAELETTRHDCEGVRNELTNIDAVHDDAVGELQRALNTANLHAAGPALLVTAHVVFRDGNVPAGVTDRCTMTVRNVGGVRCAASVMCGATEVFPLLEPPDVICDGWTERPGQPLSLAAAHATVNARLPPLLAYDASARTLDVRETAEDGFTLHMRVDEVLPYQLR
jgi:hypothetical protein